MKRRIVIGVNYLTAVSVRLMERTPRDCSVNGETGWACFSLYSSTLVCLVNYSVLTRVVSAPAVLCGKYKAVSSLLLVFFLGELLRISGLTQSSQSTRAPFSVVCPWVGGILLEEARDGGSLSGVVNAFTVSFMRELSRRWWFLLLLRQTMIETTASMSRTMIAPEPHATRMIKERLDGLDNWPFKCAGWTVDDRLMTTVTSANEYNLGVPRSAAINRRIKIYKRSQKHKLYFAPWIRSAGRQCKSRNAGPVGKQIADAKIRRVFGVYRTINCTHQRSVHGMVQETEKGRYINAINSAF